MIKRGLILTLLVGLLLAWTAPVLAAPLAGDGGGVHFGPYTLPAGESQTGDLVVFGPATLESESSFQGELAVFGALTLEAGATVAGDVVVMGAADIRGQIDGDLAVGGAAHLFPTAHVTGDVSAVELLRDPGAQIDGSVTPMEEMRGYRWGPWPAPVTITPRPEPPMALRIFLRVGRAVLTVALAALAALVVTSLWPVQVRRISRVVEETPAASFGMGLLALLATAIVVLVLAVTICLSPLALIGLIILGIGMLLGLIGLGVLLGERLLALGSREKPASPVGAAILGTLVVVTVLALANLISGWVYVPLLCLVMMPAVGAVVLTRFGTMPYATRGTVPPAAAPAIRPAPLPPQPPVPPAPPVMPKPAEPPVEPEPPVEVPPEPVPPVE